MANGLRSVEKEEFWRLHVEAQVSGRFEIRAYCRQHELSEPAFYAWRRELKRRDAGLPLPKRVSKPRVPKDCPTPDLNSDLDSVSLKHGTVQSISGGAMFVALDVISATASTLHDAPDTARHAMLEIEDTSGVVIRLREDVPEEILRRVIAACRQEVRSC